MKRSDLIEKLSYASDISHHKAEQVVVEMFEAMSAALRDNDRVEIRGFGSFENREYPGHSGRNPKTGLEVTVGAKRRPFFKCGKQLKKKLASL